MADEQGGDGKDQPRDEDQHDGDQQDRSDKQQGDGKSDDGKSDKSDQDQNGDEDGKDDKKDENEGPPLYKRPIFWIVAGIVAAVLIVGGILYWLHARKYVSSDDAFVDAHIVRIAAQTSGQLTRVIDRDNRDVKPGDLLAVIEPGTPEAQLAEAQAGVSQADAGIEQAEARVISALATERQQAANAVAPAAQALRAADDYRRYAALRKLDAAAASASQVEQARTESVAQAAQAEAAQRQVDTAHADVLAARKEVKSARAQRAAAIARVQQAQVVNSYLRITAPVNGQVVQRNVEVGSYVAPGQQLMAIVPNDMWVTANFKETQLAHMRPGQPVEIRIDAYPGVKFHGHVDSVQHGAGQAFQLLPPQNATGNYVKVVQRVPVRIDFDGSEWRHYAIGPGMSVVPTVKVR
jgi:membrane fusion protein, multidrug efflux system